MKRKYPYYGKSKVSGVIVYFTEPSTGIVIIQTTGLDKERENYWDWVEEAFIPIKNKKEIKKLEKKRFLFKC